jgi:hypothetical protein
MTARIPLPHLSLPIVIRRDQIWFSELVGLGIVAVIVAVFGAISTTAILNEVAIRTNLHRIAGLKTDQIRLSDSLDQLQQQVLVSSTINTFTGHRLPRQSVTQLADLVCQNSRTFGYDPLLVLSVISVESFFDPKARGQYQSGNQSGAVGLMQLRFETAQDVANHLGIPLKNEKDLFVPEVNVALGVAYLTQLIAQFRSLKLGILAYNQGPGVVAQSLSERRPLSIDYYNKVLHSYYRLKRTHEKGAEG